MAMKQAAGVLAAILTIAGTTLNSHADPVYIEPVKMRVTCYTATGNPTASGMIPQEYICAAKRDWLGKVAVVYTMDMEYVGCFEIRDTGGHERIRNGTSIDIYRDSLERAYEWVREYGDYMMVQIVDAKG